jgi:hypothetical protein
MAQTKPVETGAASEAEAANAPEVDKLANSGDRLGHLVCFLCYPAFDGALKAPHDAVCLCGKPVRRGETPGSPGAQLCVVCGELWLDHRALMHSRPRP